MEIRGLGGISKPLSLSGRIGKGRKSKGFYTGVSLEERHGNQSIGWCAGKKGVVPILGVADYVSPVVSGAIELRASECGAASGGD
jgi:hypothetical protein